MSRELEETNAGIERLVKHENESRLSQAMQKAFGDQWHSHTTNYLPSSDDLVSILVEDLHVVQFNTNGGTQIKPVYDVVHGGVLDYPSTPKKDGMIFSGWFADPGLKRAWSFSQDAVTADMTLYAKWDTIGIGNNGPAGGYVFYDKGYYSNDWRYLEVSPSNTETMATVWGSNEIRIGTEESDGIGLGAANTVKIVESLRGGVYAAKICSDLVVVHNGVSYDDWYLPSKTELNLLYQASKSNNAGNFSRNFYWSSSENSTNTAWGQYFYSGQLDAILKNRMGFVRAIRAF